MTKIERRFDMSYEELLSALDTINGTIEESNVIKAIKLSKEHDLTEKEIQLLGKVNGMHYDEIEAIKENQKMRKEEL